jgi:hypothetical protein
VRRQRKIVVKRQYYEAKARRMALGPELAFHGAARPDHAV